MTIKTLLRAATRTRGRGVLDEPEQRFAIKSFDSLKLRASDLIGYKDLLDFIPEYGALHQGPTNSCFAHAWCMGEVINLAALHGIHSPLPSRRQAYYWGRWLAGEGMADDGCYPSVFLEAMSLYGLVAESQFPWKPLRINEVPKMSHRWDAHSHSGQRQSYLIYSKDQQYRIDAARKSISSGCPFILNIPVSIPFEDSVSGEEVVFPWNYASRGYHAVLGIGCEKDGTTIILNSWGKQHGTNGMCILNRDYLLQSPTIAVMKIERPVA